MSPAVQELLDHLDALGIEAEPWNLMSMGVAAMAVAGMV